MQPGSMRRFFRILFLIIILLILFPFGADFLIHANAKKKTFNSVENIQHNKVGLLLGTSKYVKEGGINLYFKWRIDAAVQLFNSGKIDYILVSGDNSTQYYNEPETFKKELISRGIPESKIVLDYAGLRTLDSVIRSKKIFGQSSITIISQEFHNERAIFIAERNGIKAIGFNAKDVGKGLGIKVKQREFLARSKALLDVIMRVQPKHLGEEIVID